MDSYNRVLGLFTVAILALTALFSAPEAALAQDVARGDFYQGGLLYGASGSGLAISEGEEALFTNPANIQPDTSFEKKGKTSVVVSAPSVMASCSNGASYAALANSTTPSGGQECNSLTERNFIGGSYQNFAFGVFNLYEERPTANGFASTSDSGGAIVGGSLPLNDYVRVGASAKLVMTQNGTEDLNSNSLNPGAMTVTSDDLWTMDPSGRSVLGEKLGVAPAADAGFTASTKGFLSFAVAFVAKNIGGVNYHTYTSGIDTPERVGASYSLGLSAQVKDKTGRAVSASVDLRDEQALHPASDDPAIKKSWTEERNMLHVGARGVLSNWLSFSLGLFQGSPSAGLVLTYHCLAIEGAASLSSSAYGGPSASSSSALAASQSASSSPATNLDGPPGSVLVKATLNN